MHLILSILWLMTTQGHGIHQPPDSTAQLSMLEEVLIIGKIPLEYLVKNLPLESLFTDMIFKIQQQ